MNANRIIANANDRMTADIRLYCKIRKMRISEFSPDELFFEWYKRLQQKREKKLKKKMTYLLER